ncbi:MAG: Tfx family DNA-binding protein [Candidatus Hydrothermarchaeota archaeon]
MKGTFLTDKQIKILELRNKNYTQSEIAELIGTSVSNVSILEKRAKENVRRAKRTLELYQLLLCPVRITIEEDTDLFEIPERVYEVANSMGIKVSLDSPSMIENINVRGLAKGRKIKREFMIGLRNDGGVEIFEVGSDEISGL